MPHSLKIHEQAHYEYIEAYGWYEMKQLGLGDRFMAAVEEKLEQIKANPEYYSKTLKNFRQVKVHNFPFSIVYEFYSRRKLVHIASIFHNSRNPRIKYRKEVR
ncbi:MAG: Plasmid stabilization system protein [Flavipsychrobacter sp.]|jgi:mRNA-degrading endonuclease RelE of RelBE toxin-antitoxin system|nr:Plasmid stabilization system protein [Flavipsychrobacter sp.]